MRELFKNVWSMEADVMFLVAVIYVCMTLLVPGPQPYQTNPLSRRLKQWFALLFAALIYVGTNGSRAQPTLLQTSACHQQLT